jgi:cobalt-zinc-cadmium efflux system membrane fusion protein
MNRRIKNGLLALFMLIMTISLFTACGKKEPSRVEKTDTHAEEHDEHDEHDGHEEHGEHDKHAEEGVITLSPESQKAAEIETQRVVSESLSIPISATAAIELNAERVSRISSKISGKLAKLIVSQGDRVKAGQPLAYFDSPEIGQIGAEYQKAKTKLDLARKNLKREETLFEKKISPEKDVFKARQELSEIEIDLRFLMEKFHLLGIDITRVETEGENECPHPLIPIPSPISGTVIEKSVSQGEEVCVEKILFTVADLSSLWVIIDIYEKDIPHIKTGMTVEISVSSFPDKIFRGRISYIGDTMDEKTRTVKARVTVDNSNRLLKPGMFASVFIETRTEQVEKIIAISGESVLIDGTKRYVFVQIAPDKFKRKEIAIKRMFGKKVEIAEGIKEGDSVVIKGAFKLKSEADTNIEELGCTH